MPTFEHSPSDRVQVVGLGDLLPPGSCIVCGSGNYEGGYVDFNVFLEMEGKLYICGTCMVQGAELIGMLTAGEAQFLQEQNSEIAKQLTALTSELDKANERLAAYDLVLANASRVTIGSGNSSGAGSSEGDETPASVTGSANEGEPVAQEPVTSEGPADTSGPTGSDSITKKRRAIEL